MGRAASSMSAGLIPVASPNARRTRLIRPASILTSRAARCVRVSFRFPIRRNDAGFIGSPAEHAGTPWVCPQRGAPTTRDPFDCRVGGEIQMPDAAAACPYCGSPAAFLASSASLYQGRDYGPAWACSPCGAWVGCHPGATRPLTLSAPRPRALASSARLATPRPARSNPG